MLRQTDISPQTNLACYLVGKQTTFLNNSHLHGYSKLKSLHVPTEKLL